MSNYIKPFALEQRVVGEILLVRFSDNSIKAYDAVKLGCEWFRMSNDAFASIYGFNFNPSEHGLYERCRKIVYGEC